MNDALNILILSCGTRNKVVEYFKNELNGKGIVVATDCSELAPALYEADKYFIVPRINEDGYLDVIIEICKNYDIKGVLSLIDPELSILARNRDKFLEIGVMPIISDYDLVELCFNKYKMYEYLLSNNFPTAVSYIDKEKFYDDIDKGLIDFPVFVKPVIGSASINVSKVYSREEIELLFNKFDNLMIQEYMNGIEYGIDVYIDMISTDPVAIFIKEKLKMRAGETDKSISIKDEKLFELIISFVKKAGFKGILDIDVFKVDNNYFISEVNPRFGGGYPHAYNNNINIPKMIINNIRGKRNKEIIGEYEEGNYMIKYSDIKII